MVDLEKLKKIRRAEILRKWRVVECGECGTRFPDLLVQLGGKGRCPIEGWHPTNAVEMTDSEAERIFLSAEAVDAKDLAIRQAMWQRSQNWRSCAPDRKGDDELLGNIAQKKDTWGGYGR